MIIIKIKIKRNKITIISFLKKLIFIYFLIIISSVFFSCEKNYENNDRTNNFPLRIIINANLYFKEKGSLKCFIYSPIIKEYNSYTLFPHGLYLFIRYENNKYTYIKANWMKLIGKIFYHFKGNIKIKNSDGYFLNTEEIFLDKKNNKVFSNKKTNIINSNGINLIAKKGIESTINLNKIKLKDVNGIIPF